jgi:hypothetical protein
MLTVRDDRNRNHDEMLMNRAHLALKICRKLLQTKRAIKRLTIIWLWLWRCKVNSLVRPLWEISSIKIVLKMEVAGMCFFDDTAVAPRGVPPNTLGQDIAGENRIFAYTVQ